MCLSLHLRPVPHLSLFLFFPLLLPSSLSPLFTLSSLSPLILSLSPLSLSLTSLFSLSLSFSLLFSFSPLLSLSSSPSFLSSPLDSPSPYSSVCLLDSPRTRIVMRCGASREGKRKTLRLKITPQTKWVCLPHPLLVRLTVNTTHARHQETLEIT